MLLLTPYTLRHCTLQLEWIPLSQQHLYIQSPSAPTSSQLTDKPTRLFDVGGNRSTNREIVQTPQRQPPRSGSDPGLWCCVLANPGFSLIGICCLSQGHGPFNLTLRLHSSESTLFSPFVRIHHPNMISANLIVFSQFQHFPPLCPGACLLLANSPRI